MRIAFPQMAKGEAMRRHLHPERETATVYPDCGASACLKKGRA
jgi:hypothetical protein